MCGRSTITASEKIIEVRLGANFKEDEGRQLLLPNYNVTPTTLQAARTNHSGESITLLRWGLIPPWAKDSKVGYRMINARVETVADKPAFKHALRLRRCIIPMDGYYEWQTDGKSKQPYRIVLTDQALFTCAGLWEEWTDPSTGEVVSTYTIITQPSNKALTAIHDRMPAILTPEQESLWLDDDLTTSDHLGLITPYPDDLVKAYPVSKAVGNVKNNDRSLIDPIEPPDTSTAVQGTLF